MLSVRQVREIVEGAEPDGCTAVVGHPLGPARCLPGVDRDVAAAAHQHPEHADDRADVSTYADQDAVTGADAVPAQRRGHPTGLVDERCEAQLFLATPDRRGLGGARRLGEDEVVQAGLGGLQRVTPPPGELGLPLLRGDQRNLAREELGRGDGRAQHREHAVRQLTCIGRCVGRSGELHGEPTLGAPAHHDVDPGEARVHRVRRRRTAPVGRHGPVGERPGGPVVEIDLEDRRETAVALLVPEALDDLWEGERSPRHGGCSARGDRDDVLCQGPAPGRVDDDGDLVVEGTDTRVRTGGRPDGERVRAGRSTQHQAEARQHHRAGVST